MADLSTHYKERNPEETIQIIKDFFISNNFIIKEKIVEQTEAGTWYCHIQLFQDKIKIGAANGKGITREYSLASGYAELYERFCNFDFFNNNIFFFNSIQQNNLKNYNYNFNSEEKLLSYDELISECTSIKEYLSYYTDNNEILSKAIINFITNNKPVCIPMKNIFNNNKIYVDPRILIRVTNGIGMATGNTLEEALNHGLSEIIRKKIEIELYHDWETKTYYSLNLDNITNINLKNIINNIKNKGYQIHLIDLSYTYNLPAVMALLIDQKNSIINFNLGVFPIFDIAVEQALTQLYQGIVSFDEEYYKIKLQCPSAPYSFQQIYDNYNFQYDLIFPFQFFQNIQLIESYNNKVFINNTSNNTEILHYFLTLSEKNNYNFYYINNSLTDKLFAIYILSDSGQFYGYNQFLQVRDNLGLQKTLLLLQKYNNFYNNLLNNKVNLSELVELITFDEIYTNSCIMSLLCYNDLPILGEKGNLIQLKLFFETNFKNYNIIPNYFIDSIIITYAKKYLMLKRYTLTSLYTEEELLYIFNSIFNLNITTNDIKNSNNAYYLLDNAVIKPILDYYKGENFNKIIVLYTHRE